MAIEFKLAPLFGNGAVLCRRNHRRAVRQSRRKGLFDHHMQAGAKAFGDFLLSAEAQALIAAYGKDKYGQALFFADAGKTEKDYGY